MYKLLVISLVLSVGSSYSQESKPPNPLETNTLLYRVTHSEFSTVSYLFGTHHAFGKPFFDSLKAATAALESTELLFKENVNIPGQLAIDIINARSASTRWQKYLSQEDYDFILDLFGSTKLQFAKMAPAELYAFLTRHYKKSICLALENERDYFSLDDYIGALAKEKGLEVVGFETTEEQVALINKDIEGMPRKIHKRRISGIIERIRNGALDACGEILWYRKMNFDFQLDRPCENQLILTDRNNKWMNQIQTELPQKNCFIAVGMSHLMFRCGLIRQLQDLGYTIEAVAVK